MVLGVALAGRSPRSDVAQVLVCVRSCGAGVLAVFFRYLTRWLWLALSPCWWLSLSSVRCLLAWSRVFLSLAPRGAGVRSLMRLRSLLVLRWCPLRVSRVTRLTTGFLKTQ